MTNIAIIGHKTRGKEVIEILEMLGGNNPHDYVADTDCFYFYISDETRNICYDWFYNFDDKDVTIFTLEEFIKKSPYKVGDRVRVPEYESEVCISKMYWDGNEVQYEVVTDEVEWYSAKELNEFNEPNKEETGVSNLNELIKLGNSVNAEELQELMELVAKSAANNWCRCYKCDKIIRDTQTPCDKSKLITCHQWYDGYRTAMMALSDERIKKLLIKAMST